MDSVRGRRDARAGSKKASSTHSMPKSPLAPSRRLTRASAGLDIRTSSYGCARILSACLTPLWRNDIVTVAQGLRPDRRRAHGRPGARQQASPPDLARRQTPGRREDGRPRTRYRRSVLDRARHHRVQGARRRWAAGIRVHPSHSTTCDTRASRFSTARSARR